MLVLSKFVSGIIRFSTFLTVLDSNTKRETGRKAQLGNIEAAKVNLSSLPEYIVVECVWWEDLVAVIVLA